MDDCCAVCAEPLEWVAYGSCGHREVCSTCVVRLRFVIEDRRCCICKSESPVVFVTKAMGDYTRAISDFSAFPTGATEGRGGQFWYHEYSQAYFDDVDHYKMIKAMCRLSCSICDKSEEEQGGEAGKKRTGYRNIEQLKSHLYHRHRMFMCTLCLEGRKVFICEQKLYTRAQLNQHISTGDSEVDGNESERGGFMGHPMCEFCRNPFYGDNELYMHMSREHYTCHICQRHHPGQYDYFKNYDDLEIHFRQEHFLCEDEACLAKKFVVFQSESEMKRHSAIEHGGHMSRSKRNAALQIPTSFTYRRSIGQDQRRGRGRGRGFRPDSSGDQLSMAIQASLETANEDTRVRNTSSGTRPVSEHGEMSHVGAVGRSFELLSVSADSRLPSGVSQSFRNTPVLEESSFPPLSDFEPPEPSSRYSQALQSSSSAANLKEESFPPLPGASNDNKPKPTQLGKNTIAAHLRLRSKVAIKSAHIKPVAGNRGPGSSILASSTSQAKPFPNLESATSSSSASSFQPWPTVQQGVLSTGSSNSLARGSGSSSSGPASSSWNSSSTKRMSHSASAPNLVEKESSDSFPSLLPVGVPNNHILQSSAQTLPNVEDVRTANKSLVERIRANLEMDEDKYAAFKSISAEFRQGLINTGVYLSYVQQFGLSHLVLELAELCPDAHKRKELVDTYKANLHITGLHENGGSSTTRIKERSTSTKGKGKPVDHGGGDTSKDALTDSFINTLKKLQSDYKPHVGEAEVLSKDGYRVAKDNLVLAAGKEQAYPSSSSSESPNGAGANENSGRGNGKQRRKTSKFLRARLGDGSLLDKHSLEHLDETALSNNSDGSAVRGVWRNGSGQRLFGSSSRDT